MLRPRIPADIRAQIHQVALAQNRDDTNATVELIKLGLKTLFAKPAPAALTPSTPHRSIPETVAAMASIRERCDPLVAALERHARDAGDASPELAGFLKRLATITMDLNEGMDRNVEDYERRMAARG